VELSGDLVLGCSDGTLVVYDVKPRAKHVSVIGGVPVSETRATLTPDGMQDKRWMSLDVEPITHLHEYRRKSDLDMNHAPQKAADKYTGVVFFTTVSGTIYLVKHQEKTVMQKFNLS